MRKGTKVRLLKDNSIGVITDSAFFKLNGKKYLRYEVKKKGVKEKCWYPDGDLGPVVEKVKIRLEGEKNQVLFANIDFNHDKGEAKINITGDNPNNLKEHHGYHLMALLFMLSGMSDEVEEAVLETE